MLAHINLPGDGGGDQRGAALLQEVDGALRFGGEGVKFEEFGFEELRNGDLFVERRDTNYNPTDRGLGDTCLID